MIGPHSLTSPYPKFGTLGQTSLSPVWVWEVREGTNSETQKQTISQQIILLHMCQ